MNFEIKNRFSGNIIFSLECESLKFCTEATNKYGADLSEADLGGANLYGANLSEANLYGACLCDADLSRANLQGADLSRSDLGDANMSEANLSRSDLSDADMSKANLQGADLQGADLRDANMSDADMRDANLYGANLRRADLYGANLSGANLREADLFETDILHASCCWSAHGECGRELLGVVIDNTPVYFCGCFCGREEELRKYIADGKEEYKVSRTIAADFVSQRIKEMMESGGGLDGDEPGRD